MKKKQETRGVSRGAKPSRLARSTHQSLLMTEIHAQRLAKGRKESRPDDYVMPYSSDEAKRLRDARIAAEDRAMLRDLGLSPDTEI